MSPLAEAEFECACKGVDWMSNHGLLEQEPFGGEFASKVIRRLGEYAEQLQIR